MEEEEAEINMPLLLTNKIDTFRTKNFFISKKANSSARGKAARLDPLTMEKDRNYFRRVKENPNVPAYLSKLKDYARR